MSRTAHPLRRARCQRESARELGPFRWHRTVPSDGLATPQTPHENQAHPRQISHNQRQIVPGCSARGRTRCQGAQNRGTRPRVAGTHHMRWTWTLSSRWRIQCCRESIAECPPRAPSPARSARTFFGSPTPANQTRNSGSDKADGCNQTGCPTPTTQADPPHLAKAAAVPQWRGSSDRTNRASRRRGSVGCSTDHGCAVARSLRVSTSALRPPRVGPTPRPPPETQSARATEPRI